MGDIGGQIVLYALGAGAFLVSIGGGGMLLLASLWLTLLAKQPAAYASRAQVIGGVLLAVQIVLAIACRVVFRSSLMSMGATLLIGPSLTVVALLLLARVAAAP